MSARLLLVVALLALPASLTAGEAERRVYKRAKENNDPDAMYTLGLLYRDGKGGPSRFCRGLCCPGERILIPAL